jgi:hypothetical protein
MMDRERAHIDRAKSSGRNVDQAIDDRINGLTDWVSEHAQQCDRQAHLDEGTSERAYWHCGYLAALRDVQALLRGHRRSLN